MVKPNYAFAKRQRDLAKKARNEQKQARKRDKPAPDDAVADVARPGKPQA